jgi:hypothetical protein
MQYTPCIPDGLLKNEYSQKNNFFFEYTNITQF